MRFFSTFTGIGAMDYGLEMAGWQCVGQCEIEEFPRRSGSRGKPMTYNEALTIKPSDKLQVHTLTVIVEDIEQLGRDIFFGTIYGNFNHSVDYIEIYRRFISSRAG